MSVLHVRDLKTTFSIKAGVVRAVDDVSFSLMQGETLGIVGESGSGKTSIALSICRLLPPEGRVISGQIMMDGVDLLSLCDEDFRLRRWKDISIIFQGAMNALNPVMKVGEQISEVIMLHSACSYDEARDKAKELFRMVEIDSGRIDTYPHEFSGGMRQRAIIAMALACGPRIVIGDEPTTGLDVMVQAQVLDLMDRLRREERMSMILITHDLSVLGEIADRVAVMYAGKIVESGSTEEILQRGVHPYTRLLARSFPDVHGSREMVASIPGNPPNLISPPSGCRFHPRCPVSSEICSNEEPVFRDLGGGHMAACHLVKDGAL